MRVPLSWLGDQNASSTGGALEAEDVRFTKWTMDPWFVREEQAFRLRVLTPKQRAEGLYIKFNRATLMRGDLKSVYEAYRIGKQWGWLCTNDILEAEDRNPIDGGDVYWAPMNMVPVDMLRDFAASKSGQAAGAQAKPLPEEARSLPDSLTPFIRNAADRIARRVRADLDRGRPLEDTVHGGWVADVLDPLFDAVRADAAAAAVSIETEMVSAGLHDKDSLTQMITTELMSQRQNGEDS
jgi:hypothetical protein